MSALSTAEQAAPVNTLRKVRLNLRRKAPILEKASNVGPLVDGPAKPTAMDMRGWSPILPLTYRLPQSATYVFECPLVWGRKLAQSIVRKSLLPLNILQVPILGRQIGTLPPLPNATLHRWAVRLNIFPLIRSSLKQGCSLLLPRPNPPPPSPLEQQV